MCATSPMPPALPLRATIAPNSSVPTAKETVAAAKLPVDFPSPALIGACRAMQPPTTAMIRTANPLSMSRIVSDQRELGLLLRGQPVLADADVHREWWIELERSTH